jgi:DNA-binding response OmpR family regulator
MTASDSQSLSPGTSSTGSPLHRRSVLVVEDDDDLRAELADLLREQGCDVTEAGDGRQGMTLLRAAPVDLILLDLWLPQVDGWSFRAEQRADESLREVPVIVMTADDSPQARAIDADAILKKPFDADTLRGKIREVLATRGEETKSAAERVSEALALVVNGVGHEVANPLMALISGLENVRRGRGQEAEGSIPDIDQLLEQCWRIAKSLRTLRGLPCPAWTRDGDIDLGEIIRAAILRIGGEDARIAFSGERSAWVRGDPMVTLYLCTALLWNAVEAVPRSARNPGSKPEALSEVAVSLRTSPKEVILDVCDPGAPIPDDELARVYALDTPGRERAWGAGLRLWFVRQAVETLGGVIEISNVQDGVLCRVRLPARDVMVREEQNKNARGTQTRDTGG